MKQIWSKSLACLLCLALLVGMLPVAALAEDNPPANDEVSLADAATDTPIEISSAKDLAKIGQLSPERQLCSRRRHQPGGQREQRVEVDWQFHRHF